MLTILKPHISLNVSDIEASVAFYEKAFGVTATKRRPGYAKFDLQSPSLNLAMQEGPRTGINASHFGIQVASSADVLAARKAFEAQGLKTSVEDQSTCCYALQDKVWIEDPDGNAWEVFVVLADANTMGGSVRDTGEACCSPDPHEMAGASACAVTAPTGKREAATCGPTDSGAACC